MNTSPKQKSIKSIITCFLILVISIPAFSNEPNSEEDPFVMRKEKRNSAEIPVPWGIILNADFLIPSSEKKISDIPFELGYYIDAWQFGISSKEYGNTARVIFRTTGRDRYSGFFVETGSGWEIKDGKSGDDKLVKGNPFIVGIGFKGIYKVDLSIMEFSRINSIQASLALGYGSMKDIPSFGYFHYDVALGTRIPIGTTALFFHIGSSIGYCNYTKVKRGGSGNKIISYKLSSHFYFAYILNLSYSFNFNL